MNKQLRRLMLVAVAGVAVLVGGCGTDEKVGTVDFVRLVKESGKSEHIRQEIMVKQQEILTRLSTLPLDLSEEERVKKNEYAQRELEIYRASKRQQFEALVESQAAFVAKDKKLSIILHKQAVQYNGVDVTDDLLARLKADKSETKPATEVKLEAEQKANGKTEEAKS